MILPNIYKSVLNMFRFHNHQEKHVNFQSILGNLPHFTYFIMNSKVKGVRLMVCVRLWVNLPYVSVLEREVEQRSAGSCVGWYVYTLRDVLHRWEYSDITDSMQRHTA